MMPLAKGLGVFALVTGAGGFLGRYIVEQLLERGDRVRCLSRSRYAFFDAPELADRVEQTPADIRDAQAIDRAVAGVDIVFHTAALAGIWGPHSLFHGINTLGTRNIITACRRHGVRKLIYTSSPSVTFNGTDQCGIDESVPYPASYLCSYPQTKAEAEREVLAASNGSSLLTCALRPHLIWGPRDQHLIPRLIARARAGQLACVGSGQNLVDMIYVENAARAHLQAADALRPGSPVCGQAYFITQGEPVNCWDWIGEILALAGLPPPTRSVSYRTAYVAGALLEGVWTLLRRSDEPRMTRFLAAQLATHHYFSIERARRDFNYTPEIDTAEGMRRLALWLQETNGNELPRH